MWLLWGLENELTQEIRLQRASGVKGQCSSVLVILSTTSGSALGASWSTHVEVPDYAAAVILIMQKRMSHWKGTSSLETPATIL